MAKRRIGPFEIEKQLGSGGMGIVYLATLVKTGQKVALKVLSPDMSANEKIRSRFAREMDILQKLRNKHIVRYFWGGTIQGQSLYAMEIMDAGTVADWLKRKGQLTWEQTIDCARHICKALEHAHAAGIIHRDLKPANLFLSKKGYLKLGDFGIARDNQATALTAAGSTVGTYAYMAPEQISGSAPITHKTDLYALGCVMYELLTGRPPFQAETMVEMLQKHLTEEPGRITMQAIDCPVWLESVVMKLLEKNPENRFYDALAVQMALDDVLDKVTRQQSVARQTLEGGANSKTVAGAPDLKKVLGKKRKKKKKPAGPFYEQGWFLAASLVLLIGFVTWAVWPLSEAQLYERAKVLMETEDPLNWSEAQKEYINPLMERFPESDYVPQATVWIDKIEMNRIERQIETRQRLGKDPESEAESLYLRALDYEKFGDLAMAEEQLDQILQSLKSRPEDRPLYLLAEKKHHAVQTKRRENGESVGTRNYVRGKLEEAEEIFVTDSVDARAIWRTIRELYGDSTKHQDEVYFAEARLRDEPVDPLPPLESDDEE